MKKPYTANERAIRLSLIGSLISSVGTLTYLLAQLYTFSDLAYPIKLIGFFVVCTRGANFLSMLIFGPWLDLYSVRKILILSEILAALCSAAMIATWNGINTYMPLFTAFASLRMALIAVHFCSKTKLLSILGENDHKVLSKDVIWLNKMTHGAFLFAGLIVWQLAPHFDLKAFMYFDFFSFLANGILLFQIPEKNLEHNLKKSRGFKIFGDFFKYGSMWSCIDLLAAIVMSGLIMYMTKMSSSTPSHVVFLYMIFGATIWVSNPILKKIHSENAILALSWTFISAGYFWISQVEGWSRNLAYTLICLGYWNIYNVVSARLQVNTPKNLNAGVNVARNISGLCFLVAGEAMAGVFFPMLSVSHESKVRGSLAAIFLFVSFALLSIQESRKKGLPK